MYLFFTEPENIGQDRAVITGPDVNHIKNVLRMKPGDRLRISNGEDKCYYCTIDTVDNEEIGLMLDSEDEGGTELPCRICLFQGLPKGDKMEWIIQKNVELGVAQIVPVATRRSVVKLDEKKAWAKVKRWNAIAESAAKQSKRTVIPEVMPVMNFKAAVDYAAEFDCLLFPYENAEGMQGTKALIRSIRPGMSVAAFIGPEGGFDEEEVEYAVSRGFSAITLGKRILRTETAGMTLLSVLMFELEE